MSLTIGRWLREWRHFVSEIGIVVIGVLISLGAAQLVDDWNWRQAVRAEKTSLDRDVSINWQSLDARRIIQPCMTRRLSEIRDLLAARARGMRPVVTGRIGRPGVWWVSRTGLDMAIASGTLAHMTVQDRARYFEVAEKALFFQRAAWEERDSWRILNRLNDSQNLTDRDWMEINNAYRDAVDSDRTMQVNLTADNPSTWMWGFRSFPQLPRNRAALAYPMVADLCKTLTIRGAGLPMPPR